MCLCLWQRIKMEKKQCSKSRKQQRWRRYLPRMLHERGWRQQPVSSWGGWNLRVALYSHLCNVYLSLFFFVGGMNSFDIVQLWTSAFHAWWGEHRPRFHPRSYGLWVICLFSRVHVYIWDVWITHDIYYGGWFFRIEITKMNDKKQQ